MAILPMNKIRLTVTRDNAPEVLEAVQQLGIVEFSEATYEELQTEPQSDFSYNYDANRLDFAIRFLSTFEKTNVMTRILEGSYVHTNEADVRETAKSFSYNPIIDKAQSLEETLNEIDGKLQDLSNDEELLGNWVGLDMRLDQPLTTASTTTLFLNVPEANQIAFEQELAKSELRYHLNSVGGECFILTYLTEDQEVISQILARHETETVTLPEYAGTPREALHEITEKRQELHEELEECRNEARELTEHLPDLKKAADYMHWQQEKIATLHEKSGTSSTVHVFEGWCPKREMDTLYHAVDRITHAFALDTVEPAEDEEPPVAIENNRAARPYEQVTRLYGVPTSRDLDPTLFFSGFFFISFGLCLTDVGYGIFLATITGLIMLLFRVQKGLKQLLILLLYGGLSSTIIGLFFGGYFGVDMSIMPQVLQDLQYFDPIGSPLPFFYLTLVIGFIQIYLGLILNVVRAKRNGEFMDGVLDTGPWLLLLGGLALYVGGMFEVLPQSQLYTWLIGAGAVALVLTQGRKESNIFAKGFKGVLSLYGIIDYFSNVLSYSRLLALGLATSALAFSVNLIATMLQDMVPVVGTIIMVIILLVGHIFNLVINVLGAYIHTARLQFVEFFGKFIQGTGNEFRPFARAERNVILDEQPPTNTQPTSAQGG